MRTQKKEHIEKLTINLLKSRLDINTTSNGLYVFDTDAQQMDTSFLSPYRSDHNSIHLITQGQVKVKINLLDYTLKKNDLVLFSSNMIRHFETVTPDCQSKNLLFSDEYLLGSAVPSKIANAFNFLSGTINPVAKLKEDQAALILAQLTALGLKMKHSQTNSFYAADILRHLFTALMFEIGVVYHIEDKPNVVSGSRREYVVHQFLKLVMQKFREEKSVQAYADLLHITPKYLTTATREITGKSAGELIADMLIVEAKVLLNESGIPIAHIAESLNFSDQFAFSKFFKKHSGQNPSAFRRSA